MIFKLKAHLKNYIWGGRRLCEEYGKESGGIVAESWELSCHHDGLTEIDGKNTTLVEFLAKNSVCLGENFRKFDDFPILVKLIDARDNLSIQVHPDEKYALEHEGEHGKTEMWYVVDCEPGSSIIYGFKEEISKDDFRKAIEENNLIEKLNIVPVRKGDVFMIEAGTLHAIGKGCLIAEIQQSSNTTYRVYDYDRGRELHIEKALDVTKRTPEKIPDSTRSGNLLGSCSYFKVYEEKVQGRGEMHRCEKSFAHVLILDGIGRISSRFGCVVQKRQFRKGDSFFITAGSEWQIISSGCHIIYTMI